MIELLHQIEQIDTQIFLFFNGFHNVYWDYFMMIFSDRFVWVPFYASFIFVLLKNFPVKVVMSTIVVITLIILFSDQTASGILKPLVARMWKAIFAHNSFYFYMTPPTPIGYNQNGTTGFQKSLI